MTAADRTGESPADLLRGAADVAETAPNVKHAVARAWAALHRDYDSMSAAFEAWAIEADVTPKSSAISAHLGRTVRKACQTPRDVATMLRAAAERDPS